MSWSDSEQAKFTVGDMKRIRVFIVVISLLASSLIVVYKLKVSAHWLAIDTMIHKALDAPDMVGVSLALSTSDGQLWTTAAGYADLHDGRPMTEETRFPLGKIANLVTASGLVRMMEKRAIPLDTEADQIVHGWPRHWHDISIRQLAAHTAGISTVKQFETLPRADIQDDLILNTLEQMSRQHPPGSRFRYSQYNWWLLGLVMESIDGMRSFEQIIEDEIIAAMGLRQTVFTDGSDDKLNIPAFFTWDRDHQQLRQRTKVVDDEDSHLYSTPADMVRFAMAHLDDTFLTLQNRQKMFTPFRLQNGQDGPIGAGWFVGYKHLLADRAQPSAELITLSQKHFPAVMREETGRGNSLILLCLEHRHAVAVANNVSGAASVDILLLALTALERSQR